MTNIKDIQIPEGWKVVSVGDICIIGRGRVINQGEIENNKGRYPVFSSQSLNKGEMGKIDTFDFEGEYVTWTTDGAYAGAVFYRNGKFNCTNVCGTLKKKKKSLNMLFFSYLLSTETKKYVSYVGNPKLMNNIVSDINLLLPQSLAEQQKIAKILSTVDEAIQKTDDLIEKYKKIKTGLMEDLFTKGIDINTGKPHTKFKDSELGEIPESWEVKRLQNLSIDKGLVRGPFGGALKKEIFVSDGYKVYEQKNAIYRNCKIGEYFIDSYKFQELQRFEVKEKDFIISCSGTIGKIYEIPFGFKKGIINQALLKVTLDNRIIHNGYFYSYFIWERFQNKIIEDTQGGAMKNLVGMDVFKNTLIGIPPLQEQQKIAEILSSADEKIEKEQSYKHKLENIKKGLMNDLLTGKVRVKV